jgi:hypothetical protein
MIHSTLCGHACIPRKDRTAGIKSALYDKQNQYAGVAGLIETIATVEME